MPDFDFLVIGAGIAGAGVAYYLAPEARVLILERESFPGYHSTGRSAALFSEGYGPLLVRALTAFSRSFFESPPDGFADYPLVKPRGCLLIARADQKDAFAEQWRIRVPDARLYSSRNTRRLVPVLKEGYIHDAFLEPGAMDIDVHGLHQGFLRGAKTVGARLVTSADVVGVDRRNGVWQVTSSAGTFAASVLINAGGAWADRIAAVAGVRSIGFRPFRRTAAIVDPPANVEIDDWPMVVDIEDEFYFKPEAGKLLVSPADETPVEPCDVQPEELDIAVAIDRMQRAADIPVRRVIRSWAGLRTFVEDRMPVVGFDEEVSNFFWLAGQGGYGIQTAPALSQLAAALARGKAPPSKLEEFGMTAALSPARLRDQV